MLQRKCQSVQVGSRLHDHVARDMRLGDGEMIPNFNYISAIGLNKFVQMKLDL